MGASEKTEADLAERFAACRKSVIHPGTEPYGTEIDSIPLGFVTSAERAAIVSALQRASELTALRASNARMCAAIKQLADGLEEVTKGMGDGHEQVAAHTSECLLRIARAALAKPEGK